MAAKTIDNRTPEVKRLGDGPAGVEEEAPQDTAPNHPPDWARTRNSVTALHVRTRGDMCVEPDLSIIRPLLKFKSHFGPDASRPA